MKHREKPKYSVRQNVCFMVRTAWEKRRRVLLLCVVVAAIKVALDLAQLYVTPEILTRVEQGVPVGELLTTIGFFTAALLLLQGAAAYCDAIRMPGEVDVRCAIIRMISRKSCETSYPNVHDSKILKLEEQAQRATSGNKSRRLCRISAAVLPLEPLFDSAGGADRRSRLLRFPLHQ